MAITRLLVSRGLKNVIMCDKYGSLYRGNPEMNSEQAKLAELTNPDNLDVKLDEAIVDADLFLSLIHIFTVSTSVILPISTAGA